MEEKIFVQYIEIQTKIRDLEKEKKELSGKCFQEMKLNELKQVKNPLGTFSIMERKSWTYSETVKSQEEQLATQIAELNKTAGIKELKTKEEESGVAKAEVSESLRFQLIKPKVGE